mmetsp:Transcript_10661/g.29501  ORF Transcript_10661/g.29501 Transcript_10661/m.29501 type:complete len:436 (+) Transcript_10661:1034-2341(+)
MLPLLVRHSYGGAVVDGLVLIIGVGEVIAVASLKPMVMAGFPLLLLQTTVLPELGLRSAHVVLPRLEGIVSGSVVVVVMGFVRNWITLEGVGGRSRHCSLQGPVQWIRNLLLNSSLNHSMHLPSLPLLSVLHAVKGAARINRAGRVGRIRCPNKRIHSFRQVVIATKKVVQILNSVRLVQRVAVLQRIEIFPAVMQFRGDAVVAAVLPVVGRGKHPVHIGVVRQFPRRKGDGVLRLVVVLGRVWSPFMRPGADPVGTRCIVLVKIKLITAELVQRLEEIIGGVVVLLFVQAAEPRCPLLRFFTFTSSRTALDCVNLVNRRRPKRRVTVRIIFSGHLLVVVRRVMVYVDHSFHQAGIRSHLNACLWGENSHRNRAKRGHVKQAINNKQSNNPLSLSLSLSRALCSLKTSKWKKTKNGKHKGREKTHSPSPLSTHRH